LAVRLEEVLAAWRAAERALNELPKEAPERPLILLQAARLRRIHARLTNERVPETWQLLTATHEALAETRRLLAEARARIDGVDSSLSRTDQLMRDWLLAEQVLNRAGDEDPELRNRLLLAADEARERYQAAIDEMEPGLDG
jgi:glycosyltransferase A (GT-A) superfamily protein (DUF2064 family)